MNDLLYYFSTEDLLKTTPVSSGWTTLWTTLWVCTREQCEKALSQQGYFPTPNELNLYSEILWLLISSD